MAMLIPDIREFRRRTVTPEPEPESSELASSIISSEPASSFASSEPASSELPSSSFASSEPASSSFGYSSSAELEADSSSAAAEAASSERASSDYLAGQASSSNAEMASSDAAASSDHAREQASSSDAAAERASSDEALSSDQASDIHAFEQASSSDYWADLRPYFINAGTVTESEASPTSTPPLPAIAGDGKILIAFLAIANPHSVTVSAGWKIFMLEPPPGVDSLGVIAYRYIDGSETAPTFSFDSGTASTANTAFVTQWGHVANVKPIGATDQINGTGNQTRSLVNSRALSRIIAFSHSVAAFDYTTPDGWEFRVRSVPGGLSTPAVLVDSLGADSGTYTQIGVGGSTVSHLNIFELLGPYTEAASSDRDQSDADLSDEIDSDKHLSDEHDSDERASSDRQAEQASSSNFEMASSDAAASSERAREAASSDAAASSDHALFEAASSDEAVSSDHLLETIPSFVNAGAVTNAGTGTSSVAALPGSRVNGNYLISFCQIANAKPAMNPSAGWNKMDSLGGIKFCWAWRKVDGSETNCTWTWNGQSTANSSVVMQFKDLHATLPFGGSATASAAGAQTTATTQGWRSLLIYMAGSPTAATITRDSDFESTCVNFAGAGKNSIQCASHGVDVPGTSVTVGSLSANEISLAVVELISKDAF